MSNEPDEIALPKKREELEREEAELSVRTVDYLSKFQLPPSRTPWLDSELHYHLIADGFASRSTAEEPYKHWLYKLRPKLHKIGPYVLCRGFSYSMPGHSYSPRFTRIGFSSSDEIIDIIKAHIPDGNWSVTYHTFSIASPLFVCGLSDWEGLIKPSGHINGKGLILVQPAFLLSKPVAGAVHDKKVIKAPPAAIHALAISSLKFWGMKFDKADPASNLLDEIEAGLKTLTSHMPVHMLYWCGDKFVAYPPGLIRRLSASGVSMQKLKLRFRPSLRSLTASSTEKKENSFLKHAKVSGNRRTLQKIVAFIEEQQLISKQDSTEDII